MNRKNTKSVTTPKKSKKSSSTPKSVMKSRSPRSRALPKSPISESMKQMKINDFFKPVSPSLQRLEFSQTEVKPFQSNECPQTRYSLRNSNSFVKKLKFDSKETSNEEKTVANDGHIVDITDEAMDVFTEVNKSVEDNNISEDKNIGPNLDQMMNGLKLSENKKNSRKTRKTSRKTNSDKSVKNLVEKEDNGLDKDMDLLPVFKSEVNKEKENLKIKANRFVDKEKDKKMNYFLKNLSRLKKDKEMLNIQSIEQMEKELIANKSEDLIIISDSIKHFEGIDSFRDFIPKVIECYLTEETVEKSSSKLLTKICEQPLNRLLPVFSMVSRRLEGTERQQLVSHIIDLVSIEENPTICFQSECKIRGLFSENVFEIDLSLLLKDFYKILNRISMSLKSSVQNHSHTETDEKEFKYFLNVLRLMFQIFRKCLFKIEAIDSDEQLIELLIISFGLGVDYRFVKNGIHLMEIKKFIFVILKHLCIDEFKTISIVERLVSFCSCESSNDLSISLQIASLFPLNIDFELKRKFCFSIIRLFAPKVLNEFELNFNGIREILEQIDWKELSAQDIYVIIQLIGLSMDLPKDLIKHKDSIATLLSALNHKINSSVPKASDLEFSEIHKLLMILRSKVNVSTKRF